MTGLLAVCRRAGLRGGGGSVPFLPAPAWPYQAAQLQRPSLGRLTAPRPLGRLIAPLPHPGGRDYFVNSQFSQGVFI